MMQRPCQTKSVLPLTVKEIARSGNKTLLDVLQQNVTIFSNCCPIGKQNCYFRVELIQLTSAKGLNTYKKTNSRKNKTNI